MKNMLSVRNPRTGENDAEIPVASREDIDKVAARLKQAQAQWHGRGLDHRISVLQDWKAQILKASDEIGEALCVDTGRRLLSLFEVSNTAGSIDQWCAQAPDMIKGAHGQSEAYPHIRYQSQDAPYPLVGVISPWNFPLTLSAIDTIPALLAGCSVIIKPSEITPRFTGPLMKTIEAVPELKEVLHIVTGAGETGAALVDASDIVCFTGSVATGKLVAAQAARNFIPVFLELGGKDPLIILKSANIDNAVTAALRGSVINSGQACQSIERIYVHNSILDEFVERLTVSAKQTPLNTPDIHKGCIGPMIFAKQAEIIRAQLNDARAKGAVIRAGGEIESHGGLWCQPTVLTNVDHSMDIMRDETFGPIMPVMGFETKEEVINLANDTDFGLSAGVMGANEEEALEIGVRINAGAISICDASLTTVFRDAEKSAFKLSGMGGSRMGPTALKRFYRRKALIISSAAPAPISMFDESNAP